MRSDSVDLISVFNCLGCLKSTKNFDLQQQLKQFHQKHKEATKQYEETKQKRINLEKANKELEKKAQMAKEITKIRMKIKEMTKNVTELHRLKGGGEELALATLHNKHDELLQTVSNCKHQ